MAKKETNTKQELNTSFAFNKENLAKAKKILAKYPNDRSQSAVIPLLDIAQRQNGNWLPVPVIQYVADFVGVPFIRVYEVATFYTMFNLKPVGKNFIQVCRTTPCWLRGSDKLTKTCKDKLGVKKGETTEDGNFTYVEVECLGACVNAPMVQINDDYFEDLTPELMSTIIVDLAAGKQVKKGSQIGRQCSAPLTEAELTKLKSETN